MNPTDFHQIVQEQDTLISSVGIDVWVGMEPTFTRRFAESPQWLSEAMGHEKLRYAYALLNKIYLHQPGGVILRTLGRQYGGEDFPRWSLGYYQARKGQFDWQGPPDPCQGSFNTKGVSKNPTADIAAFWRALNDSINQCSWQSVAFRVADPLNFRLLFRCDDNAPNANMDDQPQLARESMHRQKIPLDGLSDELAAQGDFLLCLGTDATGHARAIQGCAVIELPEITNVNVFVQLLECIATAAKQSNITSLIFQGFPPPVDASVAWTTITPDPAVIEINQAPENNSVNFYRRCELVYKAAQEVGLDSYRIHYNGVVSDSGGGGQFTLGGCDALNSPFFRHPMILPRLVRYFNAHPSLSYWFAPPSIGSSSQSPRADEGVRESFCELALALAQLESTKNPQPEFIWRSLNPFLVDPSGNPHRSELNIEKLWNPYLPGRGCLGLVEFRAFRMPRNAQCATTIAVLLRSIVTMLSQKDVVPQLIEQGSLLHDKYALPFYMHMDLLSVFKDLHTLNLPLHEKLQAILLNEPVRFIGKAEFHDCYIEMQQALEFWPLVGDVASQEHGGSRFVDASTTRLQVTLRVKDNISSQLDRWELWIDGYRIPLRLEHDLHGPLKITGLRYRNFFPNIGLHPGINARNTITLVIVHNDLSEALEITASEWHPQALAYPGLPEDLQDAAHRRRERFVINIITVDDLKKPRSPPDSAITDFCLDLRWLPD